MSTLDALLVLRIHTLRIPPAGGFYVDLELDGNAFPAVGTRSTLRVADLPLVGTVTQAGFDDHPTGGARPRVTLEGGAGWALPLARQGAYTSAGGVRLSTVLRDLAGLAGEPYDAPAEAVLPASYGWPASTPREPVTGADVLADLMERGAIPTWRVDPATGRTRFDDWPTTGAADADCRVLRRNLNRGRRTLGLDARIAAFLPGAAVENVAIRRLHLSETASKLEAEVYDA